MGNGIVIAILAAVLFFAGRASVKHLKGESGCCGGGSAVKPKKKKLKGDAVCRLLVTIEGMHCENCGNKIQNRINDMDGVSCRVNLKKKEAVITAAREIDESEIREKIAEAGYTAAAIRHI